MNSKARISCAVLFLEPTHQSSDHQTFSHEDGNPLFEGNGIDVRQLKQVRYHVCDGVYYLLRMNHWVTGYIFLAVDSSCHESDDIENDGFGRRRV